MIDITRFRQELADRRVAVWRAGEARWVPIPCALTPTTVTAREWDALTADARSILSAFPKVHEWLRAPEREGLFAKLFAGLNDFEREFARIPAAEQWGHVTTRMDLFWHHGAIKIIEANCTIPAMQAYSDNVLNSWLSAGGSSENNAGNVDQLLRSILAMYREDGGLISSPRIAILHRDGDSQLGELMWLRREWSRAGIETILVTPDLLSRVGDVWIADGVPCDIVYRHIFAWRLAGHPVGACLRFNRGCHIYNPVSGHYETKAFLALVSHLASDDSLSHSVNLSRQEIEAIRSRVPWSRVLGAMPDDSRSGAVRFSEIEPKLAAVVLKRSVGYGGHQVFMGDTWNSADTQVKLTELTGIRDYVSYAAFASWAERDQSLWIAQERMSGARRETRVMTADGVETWNAWYDASIFINTRTPPVCSGGVSRIATSPIVNIGTGGGLAPFVIVP